VVLKVPASPSQVCRANRLHTREPAYASVGCAPRVGFRAVLDGHHGVTGLAGSSPPDPVYSDIAHEVYRLQ
jgi:hypothetical protein